MNSKTLEVLTEIKAAVASGQSRLVPSMFSFCFDRASTSAAFRMAKAAQIVEVAYYSNGNAIYQPFGLKEAVTEAQTAVRH